jgi:hypothetical protein
MKTPGIYPGVHIQMKDSKQLLLVVVETTLARLVIALATRRTAFAPTRRALVAGWRLLETAGSRRSAREICTSVAHGAAVGTAARGSTAIATATAATTVAAASAAAITTAAAAAVAATAAAIAAATAATIAATTTTVATTTTAAAITTAAAATIATTTAAVRRTRAAATAAAKSTTAAAATAGLTFDRFAHRDRTAVEQSAVHGLHCRSAHFIGFHFEEGEAAAAARLAIHDDFRRGNSPELGEGFLQTLGRDGVGQIAHKQFTTHSRLWAGGTNERSPARACWTIASKRLVDL